MPRKPSIPASINVRTSETLASAHDIAPPSERRLNFGGKWSYAPAPESVPVPIAPRYELFMAAVDDKY